MTVGHLDTAETYVFDTATLQLVAIEQTIDVVSRCLAGPPSFTFPRAVRGRWTTAPVAPPVARILPPTSAGRCPSLPFTRPRVLHRRADRRVLRVPSTSGRGRGTELRSFRRAGQRQRPSVRGLSGILRGCGNRGRARKRVLPARSDQHVGMHSRRRPGTLRQTAARGRMSRRSSARSRSASFAARPCKRERGSTAYPTRLPGAALLSFRRRPASQGRAGSRTRAASTLPSGISSARSRACSARAPPTPGARTPPSTGPLSTEGERG